MTPFNGQASCTKTLPIYNCLNEIENSSRESTNDFTGCVGPDEVVGVEAVAAEAGHERAEDEAAERLKAAQHQNAIFANSATML